ncbi:MAG: DNA helicase RecQ [Bacteroidota bacterium]
MTETKDKSLHFHLKKFFGFDNFKGQQEVVIRSLMNGDDCFVIMPTGGGKSMCYQLPALILPGTAIVISPLIALMKNQVDSIRNHGAEAGIAHFLNSSLTKQEIIQVKNDLTLGKTKLLYVAPESLTKDENVQFLKDINISFYAIDEAHCISEWGHDFRPEYRRLRPIIEIISKKAPIIALTATATPKVQHDIQKNLSMLNAKVFKSSFNRANLYYEVRPKNDINRDIIKYVKNHTGKSGIIYCLSRKKVEEVAETLVVNGIKALPYHAGLDADTRRRNQDSFLMEDVDVIVATIAFGMGIDKPDVRFVIHHDMPKSLEGYYQETGRAGRDDGEGNCVSFFSLDDIDKLEKFTKDKPVAEQEIAKQLLQEVIAYSESAVCRRKQLLHYFGEIYEKENCGNCDSCLQPKQKFEGQEDVELVLETIDTLKQQFKAKYILQILTGKINSNVKGYKHHELEIFAKGNDRDEKFWNGVIRHASIDRLLSKDIENYGILKITELGRKFLKKPWSIMLTKDHDFEKPEEEEDEFFSQSGSSKATGADKTLLSMLKDLRKDIAKKENLPPFVIFQDPSLEDMAIQYPTKADELKNITGVGSGKALKYGKPFVELISKYVEENEIERPMDMVVKSVINKSGLKVFIIQSIDRKVSLEDVASSKGIEFEELLTEIERIVTSGTKLDISYFIDDVIDKDHQDIIYDYFHEEATSDSIEEALKELGENDFSEIEVRLIRIKFLSEVGN